MTESEAMAWDRELMRDFDLLPSGLPDFDAIGEYLPECWLSDKAPVRLDKWIVSVA